MAGDYDRLIDAVPIHDLETGGPLAPLRGLDGVGRGLLGDVAAERHEGTPHMVMNVEHVEFVGQELPP
jgi:hypothetical protein